MREIEAVIIKEVLGPDALRQYQAGKISKDKFTPFIPHILRLSEAYNFPEKKSETLLNTKEALSAYMLYFLPINYYKVLQLLEFAGIRPDAPLRILDFGCGPGTAALAAANFFEGNCSIIFKDISKAAEEKAKELLKLIFPEIQAKVSGEIEKDTNYDLIIAANSLNEIPEAEREVTALRLCDLLSENGVIIILEPALKEKTKAAMLLRDYLLSRDKNLSVRFPCTHNKPCPMLRDSESDWCHGQLNWEGTKLVRQIDEITGFNKHRLKYSAFILKKNSGNLSGCRIVTIPKKDKTGVSAILCCNNSYGEVKFSKNSSRTEFDLLKRAGLWDIFPRLE